MLSCKGAVFQVQCALSVRLFSCLYAVFLSLCVGQTCRIESLPLPIHLCCDCPYHLRYDGPLLPLPSSSLPSPALTATVPQWQSQHADHQCVNVCQTDMPARVLACHVGVAVSALVQGLSSDCCLSPRLGAGALASTKEAAARRGGSVPASDTVGSAANTAVRACGTVAALCDQGARMEEGAMGGCQGGDTEASRHAGLEGGARSETSMGLPRVANG